MLSKNAGRLALLLIIFSFGATQGIAQFNLKDKLPPDPYVKMGKLPNGLTYYIRKNTIPEKGFNYVL